MSLAEVRRDGQHGVRPGREAAVGSAGGNGSGPDGRRGSKRREEVVPPARFESYYGRAVLNQPVWHAPDIPGYFFLGGLAGASSFLAAGLQLRGRCRAATRYKVVAAAALGGSLYGLIHDLGRPARFPYMLRIVKPTSPMSVGSWFLATYAPAAAGSAVAAVTGRLPRLGGLATGVAAAVGIPVATYTAVLVTNTAVPAWHDGHREMPVVFVGSAAASAGGAGLVMLPSADAGAARVAGAAGGAIEVAASWVMERRMGFTAEPYRTGRAGRLSRAAKAMSAAGAALAAVGGARRPVAVLGGALLLAGSAATRFAIFEAGRASAADPKYTVVPQRQRLDRDGGRELA